MPAKLWERGLGRDFVPRLPASRKELAVLLSRVGSRVIQSSGIEFENLWYQDPRLSNLRDRLPHTPVQFKYNPGDLSLIWVLDPDKERYFEVRADDQAYTLGLSLWKHRVIKRYAREELKRDTDREALILAKEELHRAISEEFRLGNKLGGRKRAARWLDVQVSSVLRGIQPPDAGSVGQPTVSPLVSLNEPPVAPARAQLAGSAVEAPCPTVVGGFAQLEVSLPAMVDGVSLPALAEEMTAGARLPEAARAHSEQRKLSGKGEAERPGEERKVKTDPDEATTFGIKVHYGRRGPT